MASNTIRSLIIGVAAAAVLSTCTLFARSWLTLEQAAARKSPDFSAANNLEDVTVSGIVSAPAIRVLSYSHLGIHDGSRHGLVLDGSHELLSPFQPGDLVEASGAIGLRGGLVVVFVQHIKRTGRTAGAPPAKVRWTELNSYRYLGLLVTTEGRVIETGENTGGDYLLLGDGSQALKVFLPRSNRATSKGLSEFVSGDTVQVTGLSSQYCPIPPYDRMFQVTILNANSVKLLSRSWLVPPYVIVIALTSLLVALAVWWARERRMSAQRQATRALNTLGEEVLSANSPAEILEKLRAVVPGVMGVSDVCLYVFRAGTNVLERIPGPNVEGAMISIESPEGAIPSAAVLCFRNKTLLMMPDTARSPLFRAEENQANPRSVMFVPMFAQTEPLGVLALYHTKKARSFNEDEQAAAQHFGNQIATSLRFLEQRTMREQLFRSEKLAATGQLISGIVDELQAPLESVSMMAGRALARPADTETKRQLAAIASEARRASDIVSRLLSFARAEKTDAKPVEVNSLLTSLIKFREREWETRKIEVSNRLSMEPVHVMGSKGQLEQVFLNLLVHAEQSLSNAEQRALYISTGLLARRVLVAISYSGHENGMHRDPFLDPSLQEAGALGLGVCRGIIQSHSGEIRFIRNGTSACRFEVELPVAQFGSGLAPAGSNERASRALTALVVEPDRTVQRQLLVYLSALGCRVVPMSPPEEAAQLVQRMKFDLVFCSVRLPGMNWLEFFESVRTSVGSFILLTEGYDSDLARAFQSGDGHILRKPVDEKELGLLLEGIEERVEKGR